MQAFFWVLVIVFVIRVALDAWVIGARLYQNFVRESERGLHTVIDEVRKVRLALIRAEGEIGSLQAHATGNADSDGGIDQEHRNKEVMMARGSVHTECAQLTTVLLRIAGHGRDFSGNRALLRRKTVWKFVADFVILSLALLIGFV